MDATQTTAQLPFSDLIVNGGAAALALVLVYLFLKHLRSREADANESQEKYTETLSTIASECHDRHREAQQGYQESLRHVIDSHDRHFERMDQRFQMVQDGVATLLERTQKDAG